MNITKERYVPPLIRPSGIFSHREKAIATTALSRRERSARSAGEGLAVSADVP